MTIDENQTPEENREGSPKEPEAAPESAPDNPEAIPSAVDETPEPAPEVEPADAPSEPVPVTAETAAPVEPEPVAAVAEEPAPPAEEAAAPTYEPSMESPAAEAPAPVEEAAATAPAHEQPLETPIAPAPAAVVAQGRSDKDLFEAAMEAMEAGEDDSAGEGLYKKLSKGDRIEATVIQVDRDRVFVDLGTKSEGIVPLGELSEMNLDSAMDHVKVGDKINVVVLRPEGGEGNPIVSKKRADFEEAWDSIEKAFQVGEFLTAQVVDRVKGGLVVDVGVRGFVPATHVGSGRLRNIEKFVGQPLKLKIIEIDRDRKKVVLSNRDAEEERREQARRDIFEHANPGDIREGVVRRLTDYGAFVDLGGVDGLLHISEMSWMRINHPREMFKEGQKINVMILRLDKDAGKISLGHRQVLPDPWNLIRETYTIGQKLTCTIGRIVQSGAFIRLPEGAEAFMPVSEMSSRRIRKPQDVLEEGQEVEAQIIDLRTEERRMVLSIRAAGGGDFGRPAPGGAPGGEFEDEALRDKRRGKAGGKRGRGAGGRRGRDEEEVEEVIGRRGFATGGATIGERLGMLKGFVGRDDEEEVLEDVVDPAPDAPEAPAPEAPAEESEPETTE
ncbi:MAG: 30S ribosomal protein S1 [Fimbriimonadaceae bacterium]|nr:30S ribosomal protein S1 [Fimbriimonadaceae bacterium]